MTRLFSSVQDSAYIRLSVTSEGFRQVLCLSVTHGNETTTVRLSSADTERLYDQVGKAMRELP